MSASDHIHLGAIDIKPIGGSWNSEPKPETEPAGEPPPLFTEPVIGYRVWRVMDRALVSPYRTDHSWPPGTVVGECSGLGGHRAPGEGCGCGLYAYHSPDLARCLAGGATVLGAVVGWGEMHVHPSGWRAERACVVALLTTKLLLGTPVPELVADRYGVPLVGTVAELEAEAAKQGSPLPDDVLPEKSAHDDFLVSAAKFSVVITGQVRTMGRSLQQASQQLQAFAGSGWTTWTWSIGYARPRRRPPRGPRARGGRARGQRRRVR